jgi:type I restriction enzyme, S subunit
VTKDAEVLTGAALNSPLPGGWIETSLRTLGAELRQGFASGRHNEDEEGLLHVRPMNISPLGEVDLDEARYLRNPRSNLRLRNGDIAFNNTNSVRWVGKSTVWDSAPAGFSNHITRIRLPQPLQAEFFAKQLHLLCLNGYFAAHCRQYVNQASISMRFLADSVPLRIPSLSIQRLTIERLSQLELQRQAVVDALARTARKQTQLREALLDEAFRKEPTWEEAPLVDLVTEPLHYGIVQTGEDTPEGVPTVRAGDLRAGGMLRTGSLKRVAPEIEEKYEKTRLSGGEVLLSIRGTVGLVITADPELEGANVSREICVIQPSPAVLADFLRLYLQSPAGQAALAERMRGVAQQGVSLRELSTLPVPTPPPDEQEAVAARLQAQLENADMIASEVEEAASQAKTLHQVILERAFAGDLVDPGDATDESGASALLEVARNNSSDEAVRLEEEPSVKAQRQGGSGSGGDSASLRECLEEEGRALTPDELFNLSQVPVDDVDRFYHALGEAIEAGTVVETRPDELTVLIEAGQ